MWQVNFNQETRNYIVDSAPYLTNLLVEFAKLEHSINGIPYRGMVDDLGEGHSLWGIAEHLVLYRRFETERMIRILLIKPAD